MKNIVIPVNIYFVIIIVLIVLLVIQQNKKQHKEIIKKAYVDTASKIIENKYPQDKRPDLYRKIYDKLEEPSKLHFPTRIPINIRTRGAEVPYQQVGYVYRTESDPTYNPDENNRLPLYGRPDYRGSNVWEYYVQIPKDQIKIELSNNKEIYSEDKVSIKGFSGDWIAEIYENKEYKYIPYVY